MITGTIKAYFSERGFGFINADATDGTLATHFFHIKGCRVEPKAGLRVQFQLAPGPKGLMAVDVQAIPKTVEDIVSKLNDGVL
jgi:cold shock CspA family protein